MLKELLVNDNYMPELFEYSDKPVDDGCVRVKSEFGAPKHGTELTIFKVRPFEGEYYDEEAHIFKKREQADSVAKWGLGNMWVGSITEIGSGVTGFSIGERVAGYGHLASTHTLKADKLLKMPDSMTWQEAMCYDPMQFALSGLRDANMRIGDTVLVSGLGAIGQMAAQAAKASGASLVAVSDPIELRRKVALENGADIAFDPLNEDFGLELRKYTHNIGVDVVIETSANYKAAEQCIRALGYRGNMAFVGWFKENKVSINFGHEGHFNQQNIFFSRACSEPNRDYPRWDFERICRESWKVIADGKIKCENIIFPIVDFDESDKAYETYIAKHPEESIKMGVKF
jgi:threonine dehydrogenase-like Zn-dependent dehydrogenase